MKKNTVLFTLFATSLSLSTFAQTIKITASPEKSYVILNGDDMGSYAKVNPKDKKTWVVMAVNEGYVTQGNSLATIGTQTKNNEYSFKLKKEEKLPKTFKSQKIKFTRFVDQTDGSFTSIGYGGYYSHIKFDDLALITPFPKLMTDWGFKVVGQNNLFEEKGDNPDFVLAGEITWSRKNTAGSGFQSSVEVKWSLFSSDLQKVVYNETTYGYSDSGQKKYQDEVTKALENATVALMSDSKFQGLVSTQSSDEVAKPGVSLNLKKVEPKKYANYGEMVKGSTNSVVTVKTNSGHGSGFIVSEDGYIITNHHVISGAESVEIIFESGFNLTATVVKSNKERDVALLKITGKGFKPLAISNDAEATSIGTEVVAIGTPLDVSLGQTVTKGIVSGKREFEGLKYIQTDVNISPGNSGGPLVNSKGEVLGVIVAKLNAKNASGLGFALPIEEAFQKLEITFK